MTTEMLKDALDQLRGAVMIVYPMGLPPYDPIRMEFEDKEDLSGTQAGLSVIKESEAQLWWAAKELRRSKKLSDYVGKNEKTKIIVKIQQRGQGAPAREPVISSEEQKQLMLYYHRRQEELKRLEEDDDDSCLNSPWADSSALKRREPVSAADAREHRAGGAHGAGDPRLQRAAQGAAALLRCGTRPGTGRPGSGGRVCAVTVPGAPGASRGEPRGGAGMCGCWPGRGEGGAGTAKRVGLCGPRVAVEPSTRGRSSEQSGAPRSG